MKEKRVLEQALDKAQAGDVDGALDLLNQAPNEDGNENVFGMMYFLLMAKNRADEALSLATRCLENPSTDLIRSKWLLRRGLLYLDANEKIRAQADFAEVMKLRTNEDHMRQAGQAMAELLGKTHNNKKDGH